jgi:hypothetical protein
MNKCVCCGTDTEFIVCISCVAECKGCDNYNCYMEVLNDDMRTL